MIELARTVPNRFMIDLPDPGPERDAFLRVFKIRRPREMFELSHRGVFGPTIGTWMSVEELEQDPFSPSHFFVKDYRWMTKSKVAFDVPKEDVRAVVSEWTRQGVPENLIFFTAQFPKWRSITGEIAFDLDYYPHLTYTLNRGPRRQLLEEGQHAEGQRALTILKAFMDSDAWDRFWQLRDQFPGAVIEFSCFSAGLPKWFPSNTLFHEVRHY